jgi:hydrogenase maturation protease
MTDSPSGHKARRTLVAGIGNIFLGDDGFGCEVVRHVADAGLPDGVQVVDYGIRGMHLAYDLLDGWDALVLVDALPDRGAPGALEVLEVRPDDVAHGGLDAHGMDPAAVLAGVGVLGGRLPPTTVVGVQVADVDEGMGLSAVVAASVPAAVDAVRALLARGACRVEEVR